MWELNSQVFFLLAQGKCVKGGFVLSTESIALSKRNFDNPVGAVALLDLIQKSSEELAASTNPRRFFSDALASQPRCAERRSYASLEVGSTLRLLLKYSRAQTAEILALRKVFSVQPPKICVNGCERFFSKGVEESCLYSLVKQKR